MTKALSWFLAQTIEVKPKVKFTTQAKGAIRMSEE